MGGILKKTGNKAAEEAKKAAKQALGEVAEIPKEAIRQTTGVGTSPIVEAMQQSTTPAAVNPQQIKAQEKTRLEYLEKELAELTAKSQLAKQQSQAAQNVPSQPSKPPLGPLVEPATRPKRGMLAGLPGKQGTKEAIKTPSG